MRCHRRLRSCLPASRVPISALGTAACLFIALAIGGGRIPAADAPDDLALQRLATADVFAFGPVGWASAISQGETDYRLILARTSAKADFELLFMRGNIQAKSYALVAIHKLDPKRFTELALPLHDAKTEVRTMSGGCIINRQTIASVIARIETGGLADQHEYTGRSMLGSWLRYLSLLIEVFSGG